MTIEEIDIIMVAFRSYSAEQARLDDLVTQDRLRLTSIRGGTSYTNIDPEDIELFHDYCQTKHTRLEGFKDIIRAAFADDTWPAEIAGRPELQPDVVS